MGEFLNLECGGMTPLWFFSFVYSNAWRHGRKTKAAVKRRSPKRK
jgi:hypothetical protein